MTTGTSTPTSSYDGAPSPRIEMETSDSYFPSSATAANSSSSTSANSTATSTPGYSSASSSTVGPRPPPVKQTSSGVGPYPLSALDRHHALPEEELDLEKQLAKPPLPRSLHSSLRAAAASERRKLVGDDPETKAQRLAEAKKEWASWAA
ncbi:uncharacterized protein B0I36DRAFT_312357 [Microdochium trichocladiopsis]|uniref:Uncharacterized protein n=1 Tax=Microdochium trichocladiopsis TaxID=1682393 RepID=A0A9P9BUQ0_9PEZI|nr:uncharacterized protein B0I36DRAFT_312357 [Microdochium trichocladiopsis]KAH7041201.1 hypothetical protein B0I36DRAFT_312357 [Microdochium trichocladiopsis]